MEQVAGRLWDAETGRFRPGLIRQAMVSRGISPEMLGKQTGLSARTIGKVRRGEVVSEDTAIRVLRVLDRVQPMSVAV